MKYRIIKQCNEYGIGYVEKTLGTDNVFHIALNNPQYFDSVKEARTAWNSSLAVKHHIRQSDYIAVKGIRNGYYRIK